MATKPLGHKSYGTIPHLPGSRQGRDDVGVQPEQARLLVEKTRDRNDVVIVQEKLDGSNVSVARVAGELVPLIRAGYRACDAKYRQHHMFNDWVFDNLGRFEWLQEGERVCGEWLAQAHGTQYILAHDPFVAFDIMAEHRRATTAEVINRAGRYLPLPFIASIGPALSIEEAMRRIEAVNHHGAADDIEGAVWRLERGGEVLMLGKWVRPDKVDGKYLPDVTGHAEVWNWNDI